jgi:hypothetical protein
MSGLRRSYSSSAIVRYTELESRPTNYVRFNFQQQFEFNESHFVLLVDPNELVARC